MPHDHELRIALFSCGDLCNAVTNMDPVRNDLCWPLTPE